MKDDFHETTYLPYVLSVLLYASSERHMVVHEAHWKCRLSFASLICRECVVIIYKFSRKIRIDITLLQTTMYKSYLFCANYSLFVFEYFCRLQRILVYLGYFWLTLSMWLHMLISNCSQATRSKSQHGKVRKPTALDQFVIAVFCQVHLDFYSCKEECFSYELSVYSVISTPLSSSRSNYFFLSFSFGGSAHRGLMNGHLIFKNVGLPGYNQKSNSLIESPDLQTKYVQGLWAFRSTAITFLFFHNCDVLNNY